MSPKILLHFSDGTVKELPEKFQTIIFTAYAVVNPEPSFEEWIQDIVDRAINE